jgi:hypothetical protein
MLSRRGALFLHVRLGCLAVVLLLAGGCGGGRGSLSGKVSSRGKLVSSGSVLVQASDGTTQSVVIQEDGTYTIPDLPVGVVLLAVNSPNPQTSPPVVDKFGPRKPPPANPKWFPIPEQYGDPSSSGLTHTLHRGANTYDIELK